MDLAKKNVLRGQILHIRGIDRITIRLGAPTDVVTMQIDNTGANKSAESRKAVTASGLYSGAGDISCRFRVGFTRFDLSLRGEIVGFELVRR